mgnify:CR=1 FL=1
MNNFNVSLLANISSRGVFNCSELEDTFKAILVESGTYSDERISVFIVPIRGTNVVNQQAYRKNENLYTLVVTGTASGFSSLQLAKILVQSLDNFSEKYATSYFLYSMFVEGEDKKDFSVQTSQERVFYG